MAVALMVLLPHWQLRWRCDGAPPSRCDGAPPSRCHGAPPSPSDCARTSYSCRSHDLSPTASGPHKATDKRRRCPGTQKSASSHSWLLRRASRCKQVDLQPRWEMAMVYECYIQKTKSQHTLPREHAERLPKTTLKLNHNNKRQGVRWGNN